MAGALKFFFDLLSKPRRAARKAMVNAVDRQLKPRIRDLGFSSAQTRAWRSSEFRTWLSGWGWIRIRDGRVDLLSVYWEKYGRPKFQIHFSSQDAEDWKAIRWGESYNFGHALVGSRRRPDLHWFGEFQTPQKAVEVAILRLTDLDGYLKGGPPTPFLHDQALAKTP